MQTKKTSQWQTLPLYSLFIHQRMEFPCRHDYVNTARESWFLFKNFPFDHHPSRQDPSKNACTPYWIFECVYIAVEVPDYYLNTPRRKERFNNEHFYICWYFNQTDNEHFCTSNRMWHMVVQLFISWTVLYLQSGTATTTKTLSLYLSVYTPALSISAFISYQNGG